MHPLVLSELLLAGVHGAAVAAWLQNFDGIDGWKNLLFLIMLTVQILNPVSSEIFIKSGVQLTTS